jgi:hypothetical protein
LHTSGGFQVIQWYSKLKGGTSAKQIPVGDFGSKKKTLFDRLAGYIRANYFIPDARVGWNKQVLPMAKKLLNETSFDYIITTGPPHSTHLIGLALKRISRAKWIADFRDPWTEVYYNNLFKRTARSEAKDQKLEMEVISTADVILTVGPSMQALLSEKLPEQPSKFKHVLNGFDSDMFASKTKQSHPEFTLTYTGTWTVQQPYKELFYAITQLVEQYPAQSFRLVLAGKIDIQIRDTFNKINGLVVDYKGILSHDAAIQEMLNADVLLNSQPLQGDPRIMITGKLMEYLATGNAVLTIGYKQSDAAKLLHEFPKTTICEPNDVQGIVEFIAPLLKNKSTDSAIQPLNLTYSRRATAKQLASILLELD